MVGKVPDGRKRTGSYGAGHCICRRYSYPVSPANELSVVGHGRMGAKA